VNDTASRKVKPAESWPRRVTVGRESVSIYKRAMPNGATGYMVADYSTGKRRFISHASEAEAMEAAGRLARLMSERDTLTASLTREQSVEYVAACQSLKPLGLTLSAAVAAIVEAVKLTGDLSGVAAAARFYKAKHKTVTAKRVAEVVAELLAVKKSRGASSRYLDDLKFRLEKFAAAFQCNVGSVTTADVQAWLDAQKLGTQSYANNRRVAHLLCEFAVARGYALDNVVADVERVKVRNGEIEIFTPDETRNLLAAAPEDFRPCLALGLFAGIRTAELERLKWKDVDLKQGHIVVGADTAKTASRRIVPIADNLGAWLAPFAGRTGGVWPHGKFAFHRREKSTAKAAGIGWKRNAMRHSFASYSFALCADAGRVAGYCGNSPAVIHRHYKQLCTPADAQKFFSIKPAITIEVLPLSAAQIANA
jgi:integrase